MGILQEKFLDALDKKEGKSKEIEKEVTKEAVEEVKAEAPVEEVKKEEEVKPEVHSNTEEIKEKPVEKEVEETTAKTPEEVTKDIDWEFLSEKLGRKVTKPEDLVIEKEVEKIIEKEKEKEYLSEFSKAYDNFYKDTGRPVEDFILANRDIDAIDKSQVIRESLKAENPLLSKSQLDFLYNKTYGIDEDTMEVDDIEMRKIKFEQDYFKGVQSLKQIKDKYITPLDNSIASREAKTKEQQLAAEQQAKVWAETVERTNSELKTIDIDFEDGFKYNHIIDDTAKKKIKEVASDISMAKWVQRYQDKDGNVDTAKIQRGIYIEDNIKSLLNEAYKQGQANKLEEEIKKDKHIDFKQSAKTPDKVPTKGQKAAEDLLRARYPKAFK